MVADTDVLDEFLKQLGEALKPGTTLNTKLKSFVTHMDGTVKNSLKKILEESKR